MVAFRIAARVYLGDFVRRDLEKKMVLLAGPRQCGPKKSLQLVLHLDRAREKAGIKVLPLAPWLDAPLG
jgi:hypothetical protein